MLLYYLLKIYQTVLLICYSSSIATQQPSPIDNDEEDMLTEV